MSPSKCSRRRRQPAELHLLADVDHFTFNEENPRLTNIVHEWLQRYFPVRQDRKGPTRGAKLESCSSFSTSAKQLLTAGGMPSAIRCRTRRRMARQGGIARLRGSRRHPRRPVFGVHQEQNLRSQRAAGNRTRRQTDCGDRRPSTTSAKSPRTWRWSSRSKKPKSTAPASSALRRAGHTGRLADYMEMATEQGLIGMGAVSVGSATTTLYGGMKPITGTNPMAFGIPARDGKQIILDFATASMSMGEIQKRVAKNEADSRRRAARRSWQADYRFQNLSRPASRRVFALRRL